MDTFLQIFNELARKANVGNYIYRGEHAVYPTVSSSLYRRYKDIDEEGSFTQALQNAILEQAKAHAPNMGGAEEDIILAELRHNGGETNVIDFTNDYLIALFFACDEAPDEPGRLHMLSKVGESYSLFEPLEPAHRVIAQKSVLVKPSQGFILPDETVTIDAKQTCGLRISEGSSRYIQRGHL